MQCPWLSNPSTFRYLPMAKDGGIGRFYGHGFRTVTYLAGMQTRIDNRLGDVSI